MALREILLTGSVPITPASKVFELISNCCTDAGIAHFCGLSQWGAGPETVEPMLKLHRALVEA